MLDISLEKAKKLADDARGSISSFCINECSAYCCRKGYLTLSKDNVSLFYIDIDLAIKNKFLKKLKFDYFLNMGISGCPNLKDSLCTIHDNVNRPKVCSDFPLFIDKEFITLSPKCPAVQAGMFYPYVSLFLKHGFKLK